MKPKRRNDINRYPSNNRTPVEKQEIEQIEIVGSVSRGAKKGLANDVRVISNYLFETIVLPAIKEAVIDFFGSGIRQLINGFGNSVGIQQHYRQEPRSYHRRYQRRPQRNRYQEQRPIRRAQQPREVCEDVFFDDRRDAELVLGRMIEATENYGRTSVGDLYNLVGIDADQTHEMYGWFNLTGIRIEFTSDGYLIGFPDLEYFN